MKNRILVVAWAAAILASAALFVGATTLPELDDPAMAEEGLAPGCREGKGRGPGRHGDAMAEALGLSQAQREQIEVILSEERKAAAPLRKKMAEGREQMRRVTEEGAFDEAAIRALAAEKAEVQVEMMVSRVRVQSRIHGILTPEQKELAKRLRPLMEGPRPHGRDF